MLSAFRVSLLPAALLTACLLPGTLGFLIDTPVHAASHPDQGTAQALFHEKGCEHCHGVDGVGGEKGPNLSGVGRKLKPASIQKQILEGGENMPAFAEVLAPDEVTLLVNYLSSKKKKPEKAGKSPAARPVSAPKPDTGGSDDQ